VTAPRWQRRAGVGRPPARCNALGSCNDLPLALTSGGTPGDVPLGAPIQAQSDHADHMQGTGGTPVAAPRFRGKRITTLSDQASTDLTPQRRWQTSPRSSTSRGCPRQRRTASQRSWCRRPGGRRKRGDLGDEPIKVGVQLGNLLITVFVSVHTSDRMWASNATLATPTGCLLVQDSTLQHRNRTLFEVDFGVLMAIRQSVGAIYAPYPISPDYR
jgi:hypothetical protein